VAGQERFRTITSSFYRGANAVLLAYDVTAKETLDKVSMWLQEVKQYSDDGRIAIAIGMMLRATLAYLLEVGCKSDLGAERQISLQEAEAKFSGQNIPVLETSAKDNVGLEQAFMTVIKKVLGYA
jgi:Ras-related protein Rab-1A